MSIPKAKKSKQELLRVCTSAKTHRATRRDKHRGVQGRGPALKSLRLVGNRKVVWGGEGENLPLPDSELVF
jgi:hypothetical protein